MDRVVERSRYESAERLMAHNRGPLVPGGKVRPNWLEGGQRFWYRVDSVSGHRFWLVDVEAGTREPAFDHELLAKSLAEASGNEVDPDRLPFKALTMTPQGIAFGALGRMWQCDTTTYECTDAPVPTGSPLDVPSPDGAWVAFRRDHNLWVRRVESGEEVQLTTDGEDGYGYGSMPEAGQPRTTLRKVGLTEMPAAVLWSPDSTRLLTHRIDERALPLMHLVESSPTAEARPVLHSKRYPFPGEEAAAMGEFVILDVAHRTQTFAKTDPVLMQYFSPIHSKWASWSKNGAEAYFLDRSRDGHELRLMAIDAATGDVRPLVSETAETRVDFSPDLLSPPVPRVLASGEVLWWSERENYGHLYLVSEDGAQRALTSGDWVVRKILHVDEESREVYFVASGLIAADPYIHTVCRVGLDGGDVTRVTDDDLDHAATLPPSNAYFLDCASTYDTPPVFTVRSWDGTVIVEVERADLSEIMATGWQPPERFTVKAADGVTDLFGLIYRPHGFDPTQSYPIVDNIYPGPQINRVQASFDQWLFGADCEGVAALGFVVVAVDGRGTPGRSKSFLDASYGRLGDPGHLEDHVAAIRQLAENRPWMDLDRVGIFGQSGGGQATVRALCDYPDFYKVGVSECGNHEMSTYHQMWSEVYHGPFLETLAAQDNTGIVDKLEGKLLLIHGEMDDNVTPHLVMKLVDRLIAANKDFELLIVPGGDHAFFGTQHYVARRRWDFFVRNLMGTEPPSYRVADVPVDLELVGEMMS